MNARIQKDVVELAALKHRQSWKNSSNLSVKGSLVSCFVAAFARMGCLAPRGIRATGTQPDAGGIILNSAVGPQINADGRRFQGLETRDPFTRRVKPRRGTSRWVSESYLRPSESICGFKVHSTGQAGGLVVVTDSGLTDPPRQF